MSVFYYVHDDDEQINKFIYNKRRLSIMSQSLTYSDVERKEITAIRENAVELSEVPEKQRSISVESLLNDAAVRKEATVGKLGIYVHGDNQVHFVPTGQYSYRVLPQGASLVRCTTGSLAGINAVTGG